MADIYVGIDPSLSSTGVSIYRPTTVDMAARFVWSTLSPGEKMADHSIPSVYKRCLHQSLSVLSFLGSQGVANDFQPGLHIIIELPPPNAAYSAGLCMYVGLLFHHIQRAYPEAVIYGTSAMAIKSMLGSRAAKKSEAVDFVVAKLFEVGYPSNLVVQSDAADSLMILFLLLRHLSVTSGIDLSAVPAHIKVGAI